MRCAGRPSIAEENGSERPPIALSTVRGDHNLLGTVKTTVSPLTHIGIQTKRSVARIPGWESECKEWNTASQNERGTKVSIQISHMRVM